MTCWFGIRELRSKDMGWTLADSNYDYDHLNLRPQSILYATMYVTYCKNCNQSISLIAIKKKAIQGRSGGSHTYIYFIKHKVKVST